MPGRGGRIGGGSRGGGFRALRASSGGSRGARINIGSRASRTAPSMPSTNASTAHPVHHHRPWFRNRLPGAWGTGWRFIGILITLIVFGVCACAALAVALQALGYGS
jgi:hypothetical protein